VRIARRFLYLFAAFHIANACILFFHFNFQNPEASLAMLSQMSMAILWFVLAWISYSRTFVSFVISCLFTLLAFFTCFFAKDSFLIPWVLLLAPITLFFLFAALPSALNYEQVKETFKNRQQSPLS
jgi:hypothetical protein